MALYHVTCPICKGTRVTVDRTDPDRPRRKCGGCNGSGGLTIEEINTRVDLDKWAKENPPTIRFDDRAEDAP